MTRGRRLLSLTLPLIASSLVGVPAASAASVGYVAQVAGGGSTSYWQPKLRLDGDTLTALTAQVVPQQFAGGSPSAISNDESFSISLPAPVVLAGGRFTFHVAAPSSYQGSWSGQATVSGSVGASVNGQRPITGTMMLQNATSPFHSGCSGSWSFVAIPAVPRRNWGVPTKRAFVGNQSAHDEAISFNYRAGTVSGLVLDDNYICAGSVNASEVYAADYGFPTLHTSATGAFHMHTYVFDEYGYILVMDLTGRVTGRHASGHVTVSEPGPGYGMTHAALTMPGLRGPSRRDAPIPLARRRYR